MQHFHLQPHTPLSFEQTKHILATLGATDNSFEGFWRARELFASLNRDLPEDPVSDAETGQVWRHRLPTAKELLNQLSLSPPPRGRQDTVHMCSRPFRALKAELYLWVEAEMRPGVLFGQRDGLGGRHALALCLSGETPLADWRGQQLYQPSYYTPGLGFLHQWHVDSTTMRPLLPQNHEQLRDVVPALLPSVFKFSTLPSVRAAL